MSSFKRKKELEEIFKKILVIDKLKIHIENLKKIIRIQNPDLVIGIAKSSKSKIEFFK